MKIKSLILGACLALAAWTADAAQAPDPAALRGCRATYDNAPRLPSSRVDLDRLLAELTELRVNCYNFLVWHQATDWDDLHAFLPRARDQKINVWVTLVPPSESPPKTSRYAEPFRLDYERWAEEIARLSVKEPNLVAWSIDDFCHNLKVYTPEKIAALRAKTRQINPRLAFVPCVYYRQATAAFAADYGKLVDGILFPYRSESGKAGLTDPARVAEEIAKIRSTLGRPNLPIILDIYATRHSSLGDSTPDYVREVMERGRTAADGVMIYCHQDKQRAAAKYQVIKALFNQWAGAKP